MAAILEPVEAGSIVAVVNKYIVYNPKLWDYLCGTKAEEAKQDQEEAEEDASSMTTSITGTDFHIHHTY